MLELHYARRAQRRAVEVPCEVVRATWDEPARHRMTDLSPYGGWIATALPLPIGEELVMCFLPDGYCGREIQVFARVTRRVAHSDRRFAPRARCGMGVAFLDLEDRERFELRRWLRLHEDERDVSARARLRWAV
jgi:hypothetical protein